MIVNKVKPPGSEEKFRTNKLDYDLNKKVRKEFIPEINE